eukprot:gene1703-3297_t
MEFCTGTKWYFENSPLDASEIEWINQILNETCQVALQREVALKDIKSLTRTCREHNLLHNFSALHMAVRPRNVKEHRCSLAGFEDEPLISLDEEFGF